MLHFIASAPIATLFAPVVVASEVQLPIAILPFAEVLSRKAKVPKAVLLLPVLFTKEQKPTAVLLTPDVLFDKAPKPTAVVLSAVLFKPAFIPTNVTWLADVSHLPAAYPITVLHDPVQSQHKLLAPNVVL